MAKNTRMHEVGPTVSNNSNNMGMLYLTNLRGAVIKFVFCLSNMVSGANFLGQITYKVSLN